MLLIAKHLEYSDQRWKTVFRFWGSRKAPVSQCWRHTSSRLLVLDPRYWAPHSFLFFMQNWWQGQDRGNTLEKSRNSILDDRSRDIPSDSMYSLGSRHQQSDQGKNDPFANLQSLDMFSSYHSSQEFPSMQRQSGSLLDGSGAIESLSSRKHNPPTTDHDLEHKLEEELLNFSISSRTEDSRKLPMNLNRAGRM